MQAKNNMVQCTGTLNSSSTWLVGLVVGVTREPTLFEYGSDSSSSRPAWESPFASAGVLIVLSRIGIRSSSPILRQVTMQTAIKRLSQTQLEHTHTRLMALCLGLPRWASTRMVKQSEFLWSKRQWVAAASDGPYARVCTSLQTDNHASTPPFWFFTGRMRFQPQNQQRQSTEGTTRLTKTRPELLVTAVLPTEGGTVVKMFVMKAASVIIWHLRQWYHQCTTSY